MHVSRFAVSGVVRCGEVWCRQTPHTTPSVKRVGVTGGKHKFWKSVEGEQRRGWWEWSRMVRTIEGCGANGSECVLEGR